MRPRGQRVEHPIFRVDLDGTFAVAGSRPSVGHDRHLCHGLRILPSLDSSIHFRRDRQLGIHWSLAVAWARPRSHEQGRTLTSSADHA